MTPERAEHLVIAIVSGIDGTRDAIIELHVHQGWEALGYPTWAALAEARLGPHLQLARAQINALIPELQEATTMSNRQIGKALGISHAAVNKVTAAGRKFPRAGYGAVPYRSTPEQKEHRRDHVVRLRKEGYSVQQIASALDVSETTVIADIRARGAQGGPLIRNHNKPLDAIDWKTPPPPTPPDYRKSVALELCRHFVRNSEEVNAAAKFVWDVNEADTDTAWAEEAANTIRAARAYLDRLERILHDPHYRADALHGIERDDTRPLRALRRIQ